MSFLQKLTAWMSAGPSGGGKTTLLVDAASLAAAGPSNGRLSPRDQINILKRLARFGEKEGLEVQAVFEGEALRKIPDGQVFEGVRVFFTGKDAPLDPLLQKRLQALGGARTTVVLRSMETEARAVQQGARALRPSTFRKALETISGNGAESGRGSGRSGGERGTPSNRRGGRSGNRPQNRRSSQGGQGGQSGSGNRRRRPQSSGGKGGGGKDKPKSNDTVSDLIDLVE